MKTMKRILGMMTFSCMKITQLVESKERNKLSISDRFRYSTHLAMCKACRSYEKQSTLIGKALGNLMTSSMQKPMEMDKTTKQKILDKLKNNKM